MHLQSLATPALQLLFKQLVFKSSKNSPPRQYPPEIRSFATTLQFYSLKGYEYVRKTFLKGLPHVSTIRKWYSNLDCAPGFSDQAFKALETQVENFSQKGKQLIVSLSIDDMSLKKLVNYNSKEKGYVGFVDVGAGWLIHLIQREIISFFMSPLKLLRKFVLNYCHELC